jgi:hypothetical protein
MISAQGDNSGSSNNLTYKNKNCIKLFLNESTEFNPLKVIFNNEILQFKCVPVGEGLTKTLTVYVDGITSKDLTKTITSSSRMETIDIPPQPHGMHTIKATLSTGTAPNITYTNELEYQIAWVNTEEKTPIIWFNKYPKEIVDHDNLIIEYKVYDPASPGASSV